jgi:hypothetical protein
LYAAKWGLAARGLGFYIERNVVVIGEVVSRHRCTLRPSAETRTHYSRLSEH